MLEKTNYQVVLDVPFARLGVSITDDKIEGISFLSPEIPLYSGKGVLAAEVSCQIKEYFQRKRDHFDLPLKFLGTDFERLVWQSLQEIPYGEVISYGDLAKRLNTSPRAVGNACRKNSFPIIVPCHRVISSGKTGGYCGHREGNFVAIKKFLLDFEQGKG
jgi:methylated-DNA-[protein]-cysteine S-methyltransferase